MDLLYAALLGTIQGLTEFFPISSSAHLRLARELLGMSEGADWLYFDLACHFGTWLSLVFFFWRDILEILTDVRKMAPFFLALLPLLPAYILLKPFLSLPSFFTGYFLLVTAALLFLSTKVPTPPSGDQRKWSHALFVGTCQAFALLPGLSRSGSTMFAGRFCGWTLRESARFSFLLAIPTILGGELLESLQLLRENSPLPLLECSIGFLFSGVVGLFSIRFAFRIYEKGTLNPFAWYCLVSGLLMILILHG